MQSWYTNVGKFKLSTAREFHGTCARELLTVAVLLRALSKFTQNLSSTGNHSRTPYLRATKFHEKLANVTRFPIFMSF